MYVGVFQYVIIQLVIKAYHTLIHFVISLFRYFVIANSACPSEWDLLTGNCYKLMTPDIMGTGNGSMYAARKHCFSLGADLVSLTTNAKAEQVYGWVAGIAPVRNDCLLYLRKLPWLEI